ncbi:hypothetical protein VT84_01285 [Gemmata sp. SH-PL17]|uniref:hypothetical protein n=1 Tax=Gemmata sp. SH-PL17 TaxID=1630693 RepID=UPI0004B79A8D|nr:hypothetical protein [Gemmata sp. SH-PL17]AMV23013.1 hypothetical protein VT84_01285 [Gemmata sp. SH-PL17]
MAKAHTKGVRKKIDRPPPRVFLGVGALFLGLNHLSVALGFGLHAEALMAGCWLVLVGGWVALAGRSFDAVWAWADPSGRRTIGLILFTLGAAFGAAEGVARIAYGQRLLN